MENEANYRFSDKLIQLRKVKGLSQEQLADYLAVSRQAVSKWEAAQALPSLDKIIQLADLFGVSVDYLVRENAIEEDYNKTVVTTIDDTAMMAQLDDIKSMMKRSAGYEFKSKTTLFNLPLVHIKFSHNGKPAVAKGIIAIGNIAIGVIGIGAISVGVISLGAIALGLLFAFGSIALGFLSGGGISIGYYAFGGLALGIYAFGGVAVAKEVAAGGVAVGNFAAGGAVSGNDIIEFSDEFGIQVKTYIQEHYPRFPRLFLKIITSLLD